MDLSSVVRCQGIDDLWNLDDAGDRDTAELRVLADQLFIGREINAEGLIARDIAVLPLDAIADLLDGPIGGAGGTAQLHDRHASHARDVALDQVSPQLCHVPPLPHRFWAHTGA